ncbi:MAG: hypothetical protein ACFB2X_25765 [Rivularia sp. (in: cyanobacteria)]
MDNYEVPPVDPNWDYLTQWEIIHHLKYLVDELIVQMEFWDEEAEDTNRTFEEFMLGVQEDVTKCRDSIALF